ncbi:hypothetical protein EJ08DRAFT_306049 [Tothia fuscella]|uniref:Uncharacterized protein n=1 Tax=Tothia fuscella TaxID=1048955 RepID=A0A9P4NP44_9PEZI|nr:hypothetical protein EJ08DRAFT_306049 [Tothia fuscella]
MSHVIIDPMQDGIPRMMDDPVSDEMPGVLVDSVSKGIGEPQNQGSDVIPVAMDSSPQKMDPHGAAHLYGEINPDSPERISSGRPTGDKPAVGKPAVGEPAIAKSASDKPAIGKSTDNAARYGNALDSTARTQGNEQTLDFPVHQLSNSGAKAGFSCLVLVLPGFGSILPYLWAFW